jgi:hypothetical protein
MRPGVGYRHLMPSALRRLLRISGLGTAVALVYGLARSTRRPSPPDPSGIASWPPLVTEPEVEIRNGPVRFATVPAANETVADERSQAPTSPTWVEPTNGMCPDSHPIKGNAGSMIFHVPGGRSYERTHAERCYCTAQHAEDDGFRQAKR